MVDTQAGGLYGVVAQPLTQDYLAAQLPMFQLKVPTFSQVILGGFIVMVTDLCENK